MNFTAELAANAIYLIVNLTLLGASVAVGVAIAFRLTRPASPRARYVIGVFAFTLAALAPFAATLHAAPEPQPPRALAINTRIAEAPGQADETARSVPSDISFSGSASLTNRLNASVRALAESPIGSIFPALWIGVALLLVGREAAGHVGLARARRSWRPASATLRRELAWPDVAPLYLDERAGPSAVGLIHPAVVLPARLFADLPSEAVQRIVRHELAHVKWRDPLVNALLRMAHAALWPSLPLWFLARAIHVEREAAADRAALEPACPSTDASQTAADYAASLVLLANWSSDGACRLTGAQLGGAAGLEDRVQRLLRASARPTLARLILSGVTLLAGVLGMVVLPITSQPFKSTSAAIGQGGSDEAEAGLSGSAQSDIRSEGMSRVADVTVRASGKVTKRKAPGIATGAAINAASLTNLIGAAPGLDDQDRGSGARQSQKAAGAGSQSRQRRAPVNYARAPANPAHAPVNHARAPR